MLIPFATAVLHMLAALIMAAFANWIGLLEWRRAPDAHWTERARLSWPVRTAAISNVLVIPLLLDQTHRLLAPETIRLWQLNVLMAFVGAILGCYPLDRALYPKVKLKQWLRLATAGWSFRLSLWLALIAAGVLMPVHFGLETMIVAAGYLVVHLALQLGLFVKALQWMGILKPAGDRLLRIINGAMQSAGCRPKAVWQLESLGMQGFAIPTTQELIFTEPLVEECNDEEIATIADHELAHLTESKTAIAARVLGTMYLAPFIFIRPVLESRSMPGVLLLCAASFSIQKLFQKFSRTMEIRADQRASNSQVNEGVYAKVLCKMYRQNQIPAVNSSSHQTHPHLYDRMISAGLTPDFERPKKPQHTTWVGLAYSMALGFCFAMLLLQKLRP